MAKKISQTDLRKLMSRKKNDILQVVKKIDSPLAKYKDGELWCIVCDTVVKSDAIWPIHINSKKHKENISRKKQQPSIVSVQKEIKTNNSSFSLKRHADNHEFMLPPPPPPKQIKSILKNPIAPPKLPTQSSIPDDSFDTPNNSKPSLGHLSLPQASKSLLNNNSSSMEIDSTSDDKESTSSGATVDHNEAPLPEGFFDDPILDAKARNVEYKDPIEEEWDKFQKELKEETSVSAQIIAEDQEEAVTDRQIVEIDEQLKNWERVLELEVKKEKIVENHAKKNEDERMSSDTDEEDDGIGGEDFDEFLSWRAKKSFK